MILFFYIILFCKLKENLEKNPKVVLIYSLKEKQTVLLNFFKIKLHVWDLSIMELYIFFEKPNKFVEMWFFCYKYCLKYIELPLKKIYRHTNGSQIYWKMLCKKCECIFVASDFLCWRKYLFGQIRCIVVNLQTFFSKFREIVIIILNLSYG